MRSITSFEICDCMPTRSPVTYVITRDLNATLAVYEAWRAPAFIYGARFSSAAASIAQRAQLPERLRVCR